MAFPEKNFTHSRKKRAKALHIKIKALPLHRIWEIPDVIGTVVQLVRIHACHAWGHGFESRPHRKKGWI